MLCRENDRTARRLSDGGPELAPKTFAIANCDILCRFTTARWKRQFLQMCGRATRHVAVSR